MMILIWCLKDLYSDANGSIENSSDFCTGDYGLSLIYFGFLKSRLCFLFDLYGIYFNIDKDTIWFVLHIYRGDVDDFYWIARGSL